MAKTESEILFEEFCEMKGIRLLKIREVAGHRRADYKVRAPMGKAVVEIKEIAPNEDDRRIERELREKGCSDIGGTPGRRIRNCLRSASSQLQKFSLHRVPTMVVIYDTTYSISYTDPYNVKTGMYGLDAVVLAVSKDTSPQAVGVKSGGRQVMTDQHNTSISAVGILRRLPDVSTILFVYHNRFARVPFDPECLRPIAEAQMALPEPDGITIPDWINV